MHAKIVHNFATSVMEMKEWRSSIGVEIFCIEIVKQRKNKTTIAIILFSMSFCLICKSFYDDSIIVIEWIIGIEIILF